MKNVYQNIRLNINDKSIIMKMYYVIVLAKSHQVTIQIVIILL